MLVLQTRVNSLFHSSWSVKIFAEFSCKKIILHIGRKCVWRRQLEGLLKSKELVYNSVWCCDILKYFLREFTDKLFVK
jgi:hypothetical protein